MTSAEVVSALTGRAPVIYDHPMLGVMRFERIVGVEYRLTSDLRDPTNTHDGITVSVYLVDRTGKSEVKADPKYVELYTKEEYERRRKESEVI